MHIPTLGEEISENLSKRLEHFFMSNTHTADIGDDVLRNFNNLLEIKIRNSQVTNLKRTMFPFPTKLQKFDFTANLLQTLPDDLFTNMPHLKVIRLGENRISVLSHSVLGNVYQQLDFLDLTGNPLKCDCSLQWLEHEDRKVVAGNCVLPEEKRGESLTNLNNDDFKECLEDTS
ncbi:uncharacterized protein CEXT_347351 [Caerostris extrusa]|uniref:LRRCT domain-containing protein n=1 Tax=Caerostris extrusa TaxID=172846 RepID=A0AAV4U1C2_CAEEX|nr:uncharacterized protein CEXT_347351 [Caerostris extrusa]